MEAHHFWAFFVIALIAGGAITLAVSNATITGYAVEAQPVPDFFSRLFRIPETTPVEPIVPTPNVTSCTGCECVPEPFLKEILVDYETCMTEYPLYIDLCKRIFPEIGVPANALMTCDCIGGTGSCKGGFHRYGLYCKKGTCTGKCSTHIINEVQPGIISTLKEINEFEFIKKAVDPYSPEIKQPAEGWDAVACVCDGGGGCVFYKTPLGFVRCRDDCGGACGIYVLD